jgi:hypothetical protein
MSAAAPSDEVDRDARKRAAAVAGWFDWSRMAWWLGSTAAFAVKAAVASP